jgi:hypothetical protein
MVAAKTTHGRYAMSEAPKRLAQRCVRTLIVRIGLTAEATQLRGYLPAGMAARLDMMPEELMAPKHPSQVAFEALHATTPGNSVPVGLGLGRRARVARARLGVGGGLADGATAVALRGRATERLATRAEAAAQAPWRAAIAAARGLKRAMCEARCQTRDSRNDPIRGAGGPPNSGFAQRPYTRREGPKSRFAQRPCAWSGAAGSGGRCAVGYAAECAGRAAGG